MHRNRLETPFPPSIAISYMEIYKDEVYDLLVERDNVGCVITMTNLLSQSGSRPPNYLSVKMGQVKCLSQILVLKESILSRILRPSTSK